MEIRDRLGQPLAVGDWCVCDNYKNESRVIGHRFRISRIDDDPTCPIITDHVPDGLWASSMAFQCTSVRKIDYKPQEASRWEDISDIWVPEGVTLP